MDQNKTQSLLPKRQIMNFVKLIFVGIFLLSHQWAFAQQKTVTGTITGEDGSPIPGATVIVKGTTIGTVSNGIGKYTLTGVPENSFLVFSFVGLETKEVEVGNQSTIDVSLATDAIGLEEVIAIGYGTARKKDLTGSIVNVQAEELIKYQPSNVQDL